PAGSPGAPLVLPPRVGQAPLIHPIRASSAIRLFDPTAYLYTRCQPLPAPPPRRFTVEMARPVGELSADGRRRGDGERWVRQPQPAGDGWGDRVAAAITDMRLARPATWAVLAVVAVIGVLTDLAFHASDVGLAASLLLIVICAGLVVS